MLLLLSVINFFLRCNICILYLFVLNFLNFAPIMHMFMTTNCHGSDQLESLSYFSHCAHSAFHYLCNLVCLCLFLLECCNVEILVVNSSKNNKQ